MRATIHLVVGTDFQTMSKKLYHQVSSTKSREAAEAKAERLIANGLPLARQKYTIVQCAGFVRDRGRRDGRKVSEKTMEDLSMCCEKETVIGDINFSSAVRIIRRSEELGFSEARRMKLLELCRWIGDDAVTCRSIHDNPFAHIRIERETGKKGRVLSAAAIDRIKADPSSEVLDILIYLVFRLALRIGEGLGICREQIDLESGIIRIDRQLIRGDVNPYKRNPTKTRRIRRIHMPDDLMTLLKELMREGRIRSDAGGQELLFRDSSELPLDRRAVQDRYRLMLAGTGFENEDLRILRRTAITYAYRTGGKAAAMELSGHSDTGWANTLKYYIVVEEHERRALARSDDEYYRSLVSDREGKHV